MAGSKNKHGVPTAYVLARFNQMRSHMAYYRQDELIKHLEKIISVVKGEVEPEKRGQFNNNGGKL